MKSPFYSKTDAKSKPKTFLGLFSRNKKCVGGGSNLVLEEKLMVENMGVHYDYALLLQSNRTVVCAVIYSTELSCL